jgi:serine/threonine protein kinase
MVPPSDETPKSLGDGVTGSDVGPPEDSSAQSLGDQSTTGDMGSSVSDLADIGEDFDGESDEIVDLESRYEIQKTLGRGGMGEVVLARDKRLNRQVAIKRLKEELGASRRAAQRFLTEAQAVAALNHFNIVQIYDYGRAADGPFIVMELVSGGSLAETLETGALELDRAIDLGCQLCEAIGVAHKARITHRDIKPANVLMTVKGVPKLTDFGLAKQETVEGGQTQAGAVLGTLDFMPPEQKVDATKTDARSDLWSLGATLYQMVTGEIPRVIDLDEVPGTIRSVLARALKSKPEARYQSAEEFREALRDVRPDSTPATSEGELAEGECPSCSTTNDSSRKFCKERECAASLRVSCLSCEEQIPVWDEVCGECGGKQAELLEQRRSTMQEQRDQVEVLGRQFEYTRARELVTQIQSESDPRLQDHQDWATAFLGTLEEEEQNQQWHVADLVTEAEIHRAAYDYSSSVETLERIPEPLRTPKMQDLLEQVQSEKQESSELLTTIRERAKNRELKGLLELLERALELLPQREDLQKIKGQLEARKKRQREKEDAKARQLEAQKKRQRELADATARRLEAQKKRQRELADATARRLEAQKKRQREKEDAKARQLNARAKVYFNRGLDHDENGDPDAAISDFTEAIRLNPEYPLAYCNRGTAHSENGDLDAAISDYTEAIRLNVDRDFDDETGAIVSLEDGTEIPEEHLAYYLRGVAHIKNGDYDAAISDYTEAIRLNPEEAVGYWFRAHAHAEFGNQEQEGADQQKARELESQP